MFSSKRQPFESMGKYNNTSSNPKGKSQERPKSRLNKKMTVKLVEEIFDQGSKKSAPKFRIRSKSSKELAKSKKVNTNAVEPPVT